VRSVVRTLPHAASALQTFMTRRAIGAIVPSSNRTVERATAAVLHHLPDVDACFARIPYYGEGMGQPKQGYDTETYRLAAWQLGHARVDALSWNGTRGAAALAEDAELCRVMQQAGGCPATTAALDAKQLLARLGVRRAAFITPGDPAHAEAAAAGLGVELAGVRGLGLADNFAAAEVPPERIAIEARELAAESGAEAILLWSTNLPGFAVVAELEAELTIPVLDSASVGVWGTLVAAGIDPSPAASLGSLFAVRG
jgi:maleate isomerase